LDVELTQPTGSADGSAGGVPDGNPDPSAEVARLVRRAQGKDAAAFTELIGRYERMALSIAYSVLGDATAAGDVAQEAFLRAWERLGDLKHPARFGPWLSGVVRNGAIDARRRLRLQPRSMPEHPGAARAVSAGAPQDARDARWAPDPLDELSRRERRDQLAAALADLDEVSRSAVVLRYYDGLSSKEIGELLNLAPTAVDMRLSRARQQLRRILEAAGVSAGGK